MEHDGEPVGKAGQYRYYICLIIFLSYILVYFHRLCPAVIALDMQADFGASSTLLGVLSSAYFYSYALMQLPAGLLADTWGPRRTVATSLLFAAFGSILMGIAPTLSVAIIGRVLVGMGVSTIYVCNFKLLAEWFSPRRFVVMGGIFMAMGGVGALISSAPLALMSNLLGWRTSLIAVGSFTFFIAVAVYIIVRNRPEEMGWPPIRPSHEITDDASINLLDGIKQVLFYRPFWAITLWSFFASGLSFAVGGLWGGPYLMQVYGLSKTEAGGVLSMFAVALIVGSPMMSIVANRLGRKPVLMGCSVLLVAVCIFFSLRPGGLSLPLLYLFFFLITLPGASGSVTAAASKELFPVSIAGTAVGLLNLFPFFGAALFQVAIGGMISFAKKYENYTTIDGYQLMFYFALTSALLSLVAAVLLTETLKKTEADAATE